MADHDFATLTSAALKDAARAAVDSIESPAQPLVFGGADCDFFEALAERNDEAVAAFRRNGLEAEVLKLREQLRELKRDLASVGKLPDRQDPLTQAAVASGFVRAVSEATTVEKRDAVVRATARQFDPRLGSPAMRDYWLRRVRELPEHELSFVLLLAAHGALAFDDKDVVGFDRDSQGTFVVARLDIPRESAAALFTIVHQIMARPEVGRLVQTGDSRTLDGKRESRILHPYVLSEDGEIFLSFCQDE